MATKIYGASDDLIEFNGDIKGEVGAYNSNPDDPRLVVLSDGTVLSIYYGKDDKGVWSVTVLEKGTCFQGLDICTDEDADPYSDVAHFGPGLKWAYAAEDWERVK